MLSTDRTILDPNAPAAKRMCAYGSLFDALTVIVSGNGSPKTLTLSPTVTVVFPGGASKVSNFVRMVYATRVSHPTVVTAQDPFWTGLVGVMSMQRPLQIQLHTDTWGFVRGVVARFVLARASCVRVVSARVRDKVRPMTHASISVLPIYVDPTPLRTPTTRPHEYGAHPVLLVVSRLAPEKRVDKAIRALSHVPEAHLYIVGDGPLRTSLESVVQSLGLEGRVHFLGWKHNIAPYYQHADCAIVPSAFEGYGMVLIEAALAGCPIVSTNVGIAPELPKASVTIAPPDEYALSSAITRALKVGKEGATRASHTLTERMPTLDAYLAEYRSLLSSCGI
jgi:glycosyltransferase involved in cell wall biosynthesis